MSERSKAAQAHIDGLVVATMVRQFHEEFRDTYPLDVLTSSLCAVGPLQSMIGLAIRNGHLAALTKDESPSQTKGQDKR